MKSMKYAFALIALGLAGQAHATGYAYCEAESGKEGDMFVYHRTDVIEVAEEETDYDLSRGPFGEGFLQYVRATINPEIPRVSCSIWSSLDSAKASTINMGVIKKTGWLGGRPAAIDRKDPPKLYGKDDLILTLPGQKVKVDARERTDSAPAKQQWEIDYEVKMAKHREELARHEQAVAEFQRAEAELERKRAELAEKARKAKAEWERAKAACLDGDYSACSGATQQ